MNKEVNLSIKKITSPNANEMPRLKKILEESFATAMEDYPKDNKKMPVPSGEDLEAMQVSGMDILGIYNSSELIGGAVISVNRESKINTAELLFISAAEKGNGLGTKAWFAIEKMYSDTKKWELGTPYFLKRNINFYINKCGFVITKYYNKWHPFITEDKTEDGDFFWFEKVMQ